MYPMRRVNRAGGGPAAAAGGCVLVRRHALARAGGFGAIRHALIDDLALARALKRGLGLPIRLAVSRGAVRSVRAYGGIGPIWAMVSRSAFTQLRRSWALLVLVLVGLTLLFLVPPAALVGGIVLAAAGRSPGVAAWLIADGALAWALMAVAAAPGARLFGLRGAWRWTLPLAGVLYGAMTLDSALRGVRGQPSGWR
jgi:hypothetical protein